MSKPSKTTILKDTPKFTKRASDWINYTVLPFVGKALIVAGFSYGVVRFLENFNNIPDTIQGASSVLLIAIVLKVATNKRGK